MRQQSARALGLLSRRAASSSAASCRWRGPRAGQRRSSRRSPSAPATTRRPASDEPYRRAIAGMYSRLAKTARELDHVVALRQPIADAPAYDSVDEFAADLAVDRRLARSPTAARSSRAGGCARCGAPSTCSASTSRPIDLRQNSDVHERTVAEIFAAVVAGPRLSRARAKTSASRCCDGSCVSPRPLVSPFLAYGEETAGELALFRAAAAIRARYGEGRDPHLDHLQDRQRLRHAGAGAAAEGGRARHARTGRPRSPSCRCSRRSPTCAPASA